MSTAWNIRTLVRRLGVQFRMARIEPLIKEIKRCFDEKGHVNILDVGGTREYWDIVDLDQLKKWNVTITLVNIPGAGKVERDEEVFLYRTGDGCDLSEFYDQQFHLVHSNSVIEHVGDWAKMKMFAKEVNRLGIGYFIQTPNFWFPIEPHFIAPFFHWLPEVVRMWIIMRVGLGHHAKAESIDEAVDTIQSARLLNSKMVMSLFPEAILIKEKLLFVTKSLVAVKSLER